MSKVTVTLIMELEDEDGEPVSAEQARLAADNAERAIRNRLMGEGFLPPEIMVGSYEIKVHTVTEANPE